MNLTNPPPDRAQTHLMLRSAARALAGEGSGWEVTAPGSDKRREAILGPGLLRK